MIALITGATSGIGKLTAFEFAKHGYNLIITGRRQERLTDLKTSLINQFSINVLDLCFDVRDSKQVEVVLSNLPVDFKNIDVQQILSEVGITDENEPTVELTVYNNDEIIENVYFTIVK